MPTGARPVPIAPTTGYGGTLNQLINSTAPDKGAGITINIPLRNRAAQATQMRSEFEYRQAQLRIQQIENQVRIEVRNAQFGVQQNRASVAFRPGGGRSGAPVARCRTKEIRTWRLDLDSGAAIPVGP